MMQITIYSPDFVLTKDLRAHIERRLQFALSRFRDRIVRVAIRLSDMNGPRGGVDKSCQLNLSLQSGHAIVIKDAEEDLYHAISRAAERAARTLVRHKQRLRGIQLTRRSLRVGNEQMNSVVVPGA